MPRASTLLRLKRFSNLDSLCVRTQCATGRAGDLCSYSATAGRSPFSVPAWEGGLCSLERATFATKGFGLLSRKSRRVGWKRDVGSAGSERRHEVYSQGVPVGVSFSRTSVALGDNRCFHKRMSRGVVSVKVNCFSVFHAGRRPCTPTSGFLAASLNIL